MNKVYIITQVEEGNILRREQISKTGSRLSEQIQILACLIVLMWTLEIIDWILVRDLDIYGIWPRDAIGLRNILFSPFLHVGFSHLMANTMPFVILGWLVMLRSTREFFQVSILSALVSGLGIWLLGATDSVHLGASGVIFGYLGFLIARGYFERSGQSILVAIIILFFYGGMLWGVLPLQSGISWLGHTFGLIGGAWSAYIIAQRRTF